MQQRTDDGSLETMNVSAKNCYYTGSVAGHEFSRVAFSMCDGDMVRRVYNLFNTIIAKHKV